MLLVPFEHAGPHTLDGLVTSRAASAYGLSATVTAEWMEAARRRGLITRVSDDTDVRGQQLPGDEWALTTRGYERVGHLNEARRLAKGLIAALGIASALLAVLSAAGVEQLPSDLVLLVVMGLLLVLFVMVSTLLPSPQHTQQVVDLAAPEIERRVAARPDSSPPEPPRLTAPRDGIDPPSVS